MNAPSTLPAAWRARAAELRRLAHESTARAFETAADELEDALAAHADEPLTLAEAVAESGYSKRRLRELVADGAVPNAGRKHAPRIRRRDLPRRAKPATGRRYDVDADADALLGKMRTL